jgi:hypothetical protein
MHTTSTENSFLKIWYFFVLVIIALGFGGCAVKLVADYDSATFNEIITIDKKVDRFYGDLLELPAGNRQYAKFSDKYVDIETDLRSLYIRNMARPLNEESSQISEIILNLWIKYKDTHKKKDGYPDGMAKLDRKRFTRLFISAANAEAAKKLSPDDRDTNKDSLKE